MKAQAINIEATSEVEALKRETEAEIKHKKALAELEISKARQLAEIETKKFKQLVGAIGKDTLVAISRAGPETKAKLLAGLGIKGFIITDGKNPINLLNTANGNLNSC